jgi:hypothetical protein
VYAACVAGAVIPRKTNFSVIPLVSSRVFQLVVGEPDATLLPLNQYTQVASVTCIYIYININVYMYNYKSKKEFDVYEFMPFKVKSLIKIMTLTFTYGLDLYIKAIRVCNLSFENKINENRMGGMHSTHGRNKKYLHILIVKH